ncbi:Urocanate hydratase [subsurface metagenome]
MKPSLRLLAKLLKSLKGKLVLTSGLGGMGRAQPLAITMLGGVGIVVEVDKHKIERSIQSDIKFLDTWTDNLDEALKMAQEAQQKEAPLSIGLLANAADIYPEFVKRGIVPDIVTDQTSASEELYGYVPAGIPFEEAIKLRESDPDRYVKMSHASMVKHVQAMIDLQKMGAAVCEYGNNIRTHAEKGGLKNAHQFPGFIDGYIRPLFCQGRGPFRWAALSGYPEDIYRTDKAVVELFPRLTPWIKLAQQRIPFQGLPARICWLGHGERTEFGLYVNELVAKGEIKAPIVFGRDHLDVGSVASPDKQTMNMKDGSDVIGDWPILKGFLTVATGASWVSAHSSPTMFSSGICTVADGTEGMKARLRKTLNADTGLGVTRLADAGYELALQTIKEQPFYTPLA